MEFFWLLRLVYWLLGGRMKRAKLVLKGKFVQCPTCKTEHERSMWSVAHPGIEQTFTCPNCGTQSVFFA